MTPRSPAQMHREGVRDAGANSDVPAPTGDNSSVSEAAMTVRAHGTAAAVQSARSATETLQRTVNAATPPAAGQARTGSTGHGERPKTGQPGTGKDKGPGARSV